jgi:hypothetical protein
MTAVRIVERTNAKGQLSFVIQQKHFVFRWQWVDAWINSVAGASCTDSFCTLATAKENICQFDGTKHHDNVVYEKAPANGEAVDAGSNEPEVDAAFAWADEQLKELANGDRVMFESDQEALKTVVRLADENYILGKAHGIAPEVLGLFIALLAFDYTDALTRDMGMAMAVTVGFVTFLRWLFNK